MLKHPRTVRLEQDPDLHAAIDGVANDRAPRIIVRDGETVAVLLSPEDYATLDGAETPDIWQGYEPQRVREALRASAGVLTGVDREQLKRDVRDGRGQESTGRPG